MRGEQTERKINQASLNEFNPFTAELAAPSFAKPPIKLPSLKSLRLFPASHELVKRFLSKCTILKADLLQDHQICCLQACMCALFSPEF